MSERKVALVTGAARGIGEAIALKFAKEGYDIVINYIGDVDIEAVAEKYKEYDVKVKFAIIRIA